MSRSPYISRIPNKPLTVADRIRYLLAATPKPVAAPPVATKKATPHIVFGKRTTGWR